MPSSLFFILGETIELGCIFVFRVNKFEFILSVVLQTNSVSPRHAGQNAFEPPM